MAGKPGHGGKKGKSGRRTKQIETLINQVELLTMENSKMYLQGNDEREKFQITKELSGKVLARRIKVGGDDNAKPIRIIFRAASDHAEPQAG